MRARPWRRIATGTALVGSLAFAGFALASTLSTSSASLTGTGPSPRTITANWGDTLAFVNGDTVPHELRSPQLQLTVTTVPAGQTYTTVLTGRTRTYVYQQEDIDGPDKIGRIDSRVDGTVSLTASKTLVTYGQSVTLSGSSSFGTSSPVTVQQRNQSQHGWKQFRVLSPDASGAYSTTFTPRGKASYRALVAGDQVGSTLSLVLVKPTLKIASNAKKTKANHRVTVTSRLNPGIAATAITLEGCNTVQGSWVRVASKPPTASGGVSFAVSIPVGVNYLRTALLQSNTSSSFTTARSTAIKIIGIAPKGTRAIVVGGKHKPPKPPKPRFKTPSSGC